MTGDFVKYISHTRKIFVTKICLALGMKLLFQKCFSRPDSALSACSFDEVQKGPAVST